MDPVFTRDTLEAFLAFVSDAVCVTDAEGVVTFVNRAAVRLGLDKTVGQSPAARLATLDVRDPDGRVLPPDDYPVARALRTGRTVTGARLRFGAAGREVVVDVVLWGPGDHPRGAIAVLKAADAPERVQEELQAAREAAEEASRLKDHFIAALSHELRAPLQPILGWTEVLRRHGTIDDITARALEAMRRNIRQQVRLVDDLLDLSRIVHRKLALRYESFDLREHIRTAAAPFEEAAALKRVRLLLNLPPGPVMMWGDGSRVQQITGNLLSNAVKFTPPGGRVTLDLTTDAQEAALAVTDTGEGIAPAELEVIFDVFRQSGSQRRGGLGLGLDLVRRLTELHGGTVRAASDGPGHGARFVVRLPLGLEKEPAMPAGPAEARRLDRRSVLIIEDNDDTRQVLKYMLELEGARVETAASGHDGVRTAAVFRPDVVLCDIGLPDIDGLEVAQLIRAGDESAATRLIALTGYGQADDVRNALAAGFAAHLTKPVNLDQLLALLEVDTASKPHVE